MKPDEICIAEGGLPCNGKCAKDEGDCCEIKDKERPQPCHDRCIPEDELCCKEDEDDCYGECIPVKEMPYCCPEGEEFCEHDENG